MRRIPAEWLAEFEAAARRLLPLRWRYAFIHTYKPVLDDAAYRSFDKSAVILLGYPDATQDADLFVAKDPDNGRALVAALRQMGFALNSEQEAEIVEARTSCS